MVEFQLGLALKPSMLGSSPGEKSRELIRIVGLASSIGVDTIVLDSERRVDDLSPIDVEAAVRYSEDIGGPVIIPTLPVRRSDSNSLLAGYIKVLSRRESMGICIVAGNPAYLSVEEASVRPGRLLWNACGAVEGVLNGRPMLLGTENVERVSKRICRSLGFTPFLLLDEGVEEMARGFAEYAGRGVAVYAPFFIGDGVAGGVESVLISYARRRKRLARALDGGGVGLSEALKVSIVGCVEEVAGRVAGLALTGVGLLVGFPAELSEEQFRGFALACRMGWRKD
ncbi:MAG: hypothetical protein QW059_05030 [Nitrososphaerota archaeon]